MHQDLGVGEQVDVLAVVPVSVGEDHRVDGLLPDAGLGQRLPEEGGPALVSHVHQDVSLTTDQGYAGESQVPLVCVHVESRYEVLNLGHISPFGR